MVSSNFGKETQPFGFSARDKKEVEKENQPFGTFVWWHKKEAEKEKQPFGFSGWDRKNTEKENQPFEFSAWDKKEVEQQNQPFGTFVSWPKKEIEKQKQPFGFNAWDRKNPEKENQQFEFSVSDKKEVEKENQPFGTFVWWHKKEIEKQKQPFAFNALDRKNTEQENQPFGFNKWDKKESEKENQPHNEKEANILNNYCGTSSAIGEDKHCALSLESMMNFAILKLGKNIKVMSSSSSESQDKYVVEEVKKIGDKAVMCHRLNFKKVVFYCHTVNATTTYMVPLVASDGTKSKALTICHHDTRGMNPNVLYEVLNVKPGNVHVCHFIGNKAVAWVPNVSESCGHPCVI